MLVITKQDKGTEQLSYTSLKEKKKKQIKPISVLVQSLKPQNRIELISRLSRNTSCTLTTRLTPCCLHFIAKNFEVNVPFALRQQVLAVSRNSLLEI